MHTTLVALSILAFGAAALAGCSDHASQTAPLELIESSDSLPAEVKSLVRIVATGDSSGFAAIVAYPLNRPYPLHSIEDSLQMKAYYSVIVDDSLKQVISGSAPADWSEYGWRGWAVGDGSYIWIDGTVYDVPYVSAAEKVERSRLIRDEIESLAPELRGSWIPESCLVDPADDNIYRIDADSVTISETAPGTYRLAIYTSGGDLRKSPKRIIRGRKESEGSAGDVVYYFTDLPVENPDSSEYIIEAYSADTGQPRLHHRSGHHDLRRAYWRDLLRRR